jgi:hypothetical protein
MLVTLANRLFRNPKTTNAQTPRRRPRLVLERLEQRDLLAAFTAGDLVVSRVGTGAAPLTSSATDTFLDEYNPTTPAFVQSITLPTAAGNALTESGTALAEGRLTASADGHTLSIAGYQQVPGGTIAGVNGVVGVVNSDGTVDISTQIPFADLGASESVRATASIDGLGFWVTTANFVRYVPFGNSGSTNSIAVSNFFPSPTAPAISPAAQLYVDGGAGAQSNGVPAIDGPAAIGTGLPNNAGQTGSVLLGFPTSQDGAGNFPGPQQFVISPDGNTIFVADTRVDGFGGILEFFQSTPGFWTEVGNQQAGAGADSGLRGLAADFSGTAPILYATTTGSTNRVVTITGGSLDGSTPSFSFTTVATAAANEVFRGVALAPTAPGATASSTTLSVSGSPAPYGSGVTLTATMNATQTGWVSFQQNGVEFGAAPIDSTGTATFTTAGNLGAGTYTNIVAVYTGDSTFAATTSTAQSATITQVSTTTTLTVLANPVATGVQDTFTATITSVPPGTAPTGTVTFTDTTTSTTLGTGTVSQVIVNQSGSPVITFVATVNASFSTIGTHSLSAVYNGDANFITSSDTSSVLVVNPTTTTVTTSDPNPTASPPSSVTLTATVTSPGGTPTGTVVFYVDLLPIASATLDGSGAATATISTALVQAPTFGISSASESGNTVTIMTVSATPFTAGQSVTIGGVSVAGYNGAFTLTSVDVTGTILTYTDAASGLAAGTGGGAAVEVLTPGLSSISVVYTPDAAGSTTFFTSTGVYEQAVQAQPFGTGDTFVYRVGDGITKLIAQPPNPNAGSAAIGSTIFVDEYTTAGVLVQSIILPSADDGGTVHAVVGNGQQSATEQLSLSGDGQYLFLTGYDTNPLNFATASALPNGPGSASVPRAVARIKFDGTVETVAFSGVQTGGNFNGVYSPDGQQFYVGGVNGVSYFASFVPSAAFQTATATITNTNFTVVGLQGVAGDLYVVGASSNLVQKYTGFPTSLTPLSPLPGVSTATDPNQTFVIDVYFTHLGGAGAPAGINTMYLSDDGPGFAHGQITKWAFDGTNWTLVDSVTAGTGNSAISFYWLAGTIDVGGNVTLNVTYGNGGNSDTGPGELYAISDANGWNAPIGTGGTHSDAAPRVAFVDNMSNEVFRGVAFAPSGSGGGGSGAGSSPGVPGPEVNRGLNAFPIASYLAGSVWGQTSGPLLTRWDAPDSGLTEIVDTGRVVSGSMADGAHDPSMHVFRSSLETEVLSRDKIDAFFRLFGDA